jgi:hypothetical protein
LRIVPRARHGADIRKALNAVCFEQSDKPLDRQREWPSVKIAPLGHCVSSGGGCFIAFAGTQLPVSVASANAPQQEEFAPPGSGKIGTFNVCRTRRLRPNPLSVHPIAKSGQRKTDEVNGCSVSL